MQDLLIWGYLILFGIMALAGLVWVLHLTRVSKRPAARPDDLASQAAQVTWIFEAGQLQERSHTAARLEDVMGMQISDWDSFLRFFAQRFSHLPHSPSAVNNVPSLRVFSDIDDDNGAMVLQWNGPLLRAYLDEPTISAADRHSTILLAERNRQLTDVLENMPFPTWLSTAKGKLLWSNQAMQDISLQGAEGLLQSHLGASGLPKRRLCAAGADMTQWFDVHSVPRGDNVAHYALDVTDIMSEQVRNSQGHKALLYALNVLPGGIAVFGQNGKLVCRNQMFETLTRLNGDFLDKAPDLQALFDRLRDAGDLPEPQNYDAFRQRLRLLRGSLASDAIDQLWELPDGTALRLKLRPAARDAVVFYIEDVSDAMSKSRSFTARLALGQSVFDQLEMPLIMFQGNGRRMSQNDAFLAFWTGQNNMDMPDDLSQFERQLTLMNPKHTFTADGFAVLPNINDQTWVLWRRNLQQGACFFRFAPQDSDWVQSKDLSAIASS